MTDLRLVVVTLYGQEYVAFKPREGGGDAEWTFPHDALKDGESPAAAAKRVVAEWSGTENPKLELMDFVTEEGTLTLAFRAFVMDDPKEECARFPRGGLPDTVGPLPAATVEDMQKTSLSYKLTRG